MQLYILVMWFKKKVTCILYYIPCCKIFTNCTNPTTFSSYLYGASIQFHSSQHSNHLTHSSSLTCFKWHQPPCIQVPPPPLGPLNKTNCSSALSQSTIETPLIGGRRLRGRLVVKLLKKLRDTMKCWLKTLGTLSLVMFLFRITDVRLDSLQPRGKSIMYVIRSCRSLNT